MKYQTGDIVEGVLTNAPVRLGEDRYGFARADDGEDIYISVPAMSASGLMTEDVGSRVILTIHADEARVGHKYFAMRVDRDDSEIDGEEPDVVEAAILKRLTKLERMLARLILRPGAVAKLEDRL